MKDRGPERDRDVLCLLFVSPKGYKSQVWARLKSWSLELDLGLPHGWQGFKHVGCHLLLSQGAVFEAEQVGLQVALSCQTQAVA